MQASCKKLHYSNLGEIKLVSALAAFSNSQRYRELRTNFSKISYIIIANEYYTINMLQLETRPKQMYQTFVHLINFYLILTPLSHKACIFSTTCCVCVLRNHFD